MPDRWLALAAFLALQAAAVHWFGGLERPVRPPDLSALPARIADWSAARVEPAPADSDGLGADLVVSRAYVQDGSGAALSLFIAWYRSQRYGTTQPHSPLVCLPGSGWTQLERSRLAFAPANFVEVSNHGQRAAVVYWYQTSERAVASEWAAKFWVVADSLRRRRSDGALVRIVAPAARSRAGLESFIREFRPRFQALYDTGSR